MPKVFVAGHRGLIGSALVRQLQASGRWEVVTSDRAETDLTDARAVEKLLSRHQPEWVVVAAGRVGGILANSRFPAQFIYENLMIEANLIHGTWRAGVKRLLNFGSGCMYPRVCPQPMSTERLMSAPVEPTSAPYAVAKWAGMVMCQSYNQQHGTDYRTVIPCTVYGPGDCFDLERAHVVSALLRRFHEAHQREDAEITLWGSGKPRREFIFVEDVAGACLFLMEREGASYPLNIGTGVSHSIWELAEETARIVGFRGRIRWDESQPDGAPEKVLDSAPLHRLGWIPATDLHAGLEMTYRWFQKQQMAKERVCVSS